MAVFVSTFHHIHTYYVPLSPSSIIWYQYWPNGGDNLWLESNLVENINSLLLGQRWHCGAVGKVSYLRSKGCGSSLSWDHGIKTLRKFLAPMCLRHRTDLTAVMPDGWEGN